MVAAAAAAAAAVWLAVSDALHALSIALIRTLKVQELASNNRPYKITK